MDIYCGNLAYATTDDGLKAAFAAYGEVTSARVVTDRMTGRSKGFGFVEMPNAEQAEAAIAALNGSEMDGRPIRVNESQPKPQDDRRGGGRGGFGGRGGRGGGRGGFGGGRGGFGGGRGGFGGDRERAPRDTRW
jgi:RNA recognition motif-containing protein